MIPRRELCARRARSLATTSADARARGRVRANFLWCGSHERPRWVYSQRWLALRPGFSAQARMPPTAQSCATRREVGVTGFDCGAGAALLRALPHRPGGGVPICFDLARVLAVLLGRGLDSGRE